MGAAGRDFHNFNVYFRNNPDYEVVAFTATQIPNIEKRCYPPELAGSNYPQGIPIYPEEKLPELIKSLNVDRVVFAYSDVSHEYVMHKASVALAAGADFVLMGPKSTMLKSSKLLVSICAVRTGSGKSQTTRKVCEILGKMGKKVVVVRHPMPYGDLAKQICQRFASYRDLEVHDCTIEEREEYEPHLGMGTIVYAGVDYEVILKEAEREAEVVVWDGGNNDLPFYYPDLHIVVCDPHRAGHELEYHPGEANLRLADVVVINKVDSADPKAVEIVEANVKKANPKARLIKANSTITVDDPEKIRGKRVLAIEDGPTLTHGGMSFGAGVVIAQRLGCKLVDPRPYAVGSIKETFKKYPHLGKVLPAIGYGIKQIEELRETIKASDCEAVVVGTPIDLAKFLKVPKPFVRVRYELEEIGHPNLEDVLKGGFSSNLTKVPL